MTHDEYADALNTHADQCEQCATCREQESTRNCCHIGAELRDERYLTIIGELQAAAREALEAGASQEELEALAGETLGPEESNVTND